MRDVADRFDGLPEGAVVARVIELSGFGSRHAGEAMAVAPDGQRVAGHLLGGLSDDEIAAAVRAGRTAGELVVQVADPDAAAAGLACGGTARILLHPAAQVSTAAWKALRDGHPVVVATALDGAGTRVVLDGAEPEGSVGADDRVDVVARRLLVGGRDTAERTDGVLVEAFLPPTTMRIVGHATVADALAAQCALLGWQVQVVDGADDAAAAADEQASHDALVVLSHDPDVDTPALAAALRHGRGYLGALGSRHTQAARRERLAALGFDDDQLAAIHGPVGLDLGSRTPAETAVAIVAEIIAHRSGRSAVSLARHEGPIN